MADIRCLIFATVIVVIIVIIFTKDSVYVAGNYKIKIGKCKAGIYPISINDTVGYTGFKVDSEMFILSEDKSQVIHKLQYKTRGGCSWPSKLLTVGGMENMSGGKRELFSTNKYTYMGCYDRVDFLSKMATMSSQYGGFGVVAYHINKSSLDEKYLDLGAPYVIIIVVIMIWLISNM